MDLCTFTYYRFTYKNTKLRIYYTYKDYIETKSRMHKKKLTINMITDMTLTIFTGL